MVPVPAIDTVSQDYYQRCYLENILVNTNKEWISDK